MATIPSPRTWVDGNNVGPDDLNDEIRDAINFLLNPPSVYLARSTSYSLTSGTITPVSWTDLISGSDSMWTSGANITIHTSGLWSVVFNASFSPNASGRRVVLLYKNGAEIDRFTEMSVPTSGNATARMVATHRLVSGDVLTAQAFQDSGSTLTGVAVSSAERSFFQARWVGL